MRKNPNDLTGRNLHALKRQIALLLARIKKMEAAFREEKKVVRATFKGHGVDMKQVKTP